MDKFKCITNWLSNSVTKSDNDKSNFELWRIKRITTSECKSRFLENNNFPKLAEAIISDELFEEWLSSIGWRRVNI